PQNTLGVAVGLEMLASVHHDLVLTAEFNSDYVRSDRSLAAYLDYSALDVLRSGLIVPSKIQAGGRRLFAIVWLPTVSAELQGVFSSATATGSAFRLRGALDLEIYPFADALDMKLALVGDAEVRNTLASSNPGEPSTTWSHLFKAGALYYL